MKSTIAPPRSGPGEARSAARGGGSTSSVAGSAASTTYPPLSSSLDVPAAKLPRGGESRRRRPYGRPALPPSSWRRGGGGRGRRKEDGALSVLPGATQTISLQQKEIMILQNTIDLSGSGYFANVRRPFLLPLTPLPNPHRKPYSSAATTAAAKTRPCTVGVGGPSRRQEAAAIIDDRIRWPRTNQAATASRMA
ncbi:Os09g0108800 [Oryza sativa Japonica Group]|uniref:Os09g0108800 protein n=1 Tax=Oryza sativa subsp. japonica TaxID=39947 RepID=A0A0P0XJJ6_ORYSJ|nr:Os09g0108800 [Oryza sativa Japonica Group]